MGEMKAHLNYRELHHPSHLKENDSNGGGSAAMTLVRSQREHQLHTTEAHPWKKPPQFPDSALMQHLASYSAQGMGRCTILHENFVLQKVGGKNNTFPIPQHS